jgi:hypothetical protein
MAVIDPTDVHVHLDPAKLRIEELDAVREQVQRDIVFGQLRGVFGDDVVDTWIDRDSTPGLVRSIVAQRYAGTTFNAVYSEEAAVTGSYGWFLIRQSQSLLTEIIKGDVILEGFEPPVHGDLAFFPDDDATLLAEARAAGTVIDTLADGAPRHFTTGQRF